MFEFYLLESAGEPPDRAAILDALLADGHVLPLEQDPLRAVYRNPDTGVFFQITLDPRIASLWRARLPRAGDEEEMEEDWEEDAAADSAIQEEMFQEQDDDDDDAGEDEDWDEAPHEIETVPVAMNLPLFCPAFFGREAVELAERISRAGNLQIDCPGTHESETTSGNGPAGEEDPSSRLFEIWDSARRNGVRTVMDEGEGKLRVALPGGHVQTMNLTSWSRDKADLWWSYGRARAGLASELAGEKIRVPVLQVAYHGGEVKTLCEWEWGTSSVLPRTDLVLLRRRRNRKGLLRTRQVIEEGLLPGEAAWEILSRFSEYREVPVEHLVFRKPENPPPELSEKLEGLNLESLESARRTALLGVVDFDPAARDPDGGGGRRST